MNRLTVCRLAVQLVLQEPILQLLAYGVLAWALLTEITSGLVTPDMLLVAVGFAATAALVRIARLGGGRQHRRCERLVLADVCRRSDS
jgi:hypothetical protein